MLLCSACWSRAGRDFFLFFLSGVGSRSSRIRISEHPPPRLLPGDTQGERLLPGLRAVTINVCSFMGLIGF